MSLLLDTSPVLDAESPLQADRPYQSYPKMLEDLAALAPAPYTPPPVRMRDDVGVHGELSIGSHGSGLELVFDGSPDFIARWFNWAVNTGVVGRNSRLHYYLRGHVGSVAYVCPRNRAAVLRGLTLQFAHEILAAGEVAKVMTRDPETEVPETTWDEALVEQMAGERAVAFMKDHMPTKCLLLQRREQEAVEAATVTQWRPHAGGGEEG